VNAVDVGAWYLIANSSQNPITPTMARSLSYRSDGRSGTVTYHEDLRSIDCYWEFGGGDVVTIVQCGTVQDWPAWARERRQEILQYIGDELIRQQAPRCRADINFESGDILLRQSGASGVASPPKVVDNTSWVRRFSMLRAKLGGAVLLGALGVGAVAYVREKTMIDPGNSVPIGSAVRTDRFVAMLMQSLVPYTPSLNRNHGNDTYAISVLLVPLDGSRVRIVPIEGAISGSAIGLARVLGAEGDRLWFRAGEIGAVDLATFTQVADVSVERSPIGNPLPFAEKPEQFLAAGLFTSDTEWFGVHSSAEFESDFRPSRAVKRVVSAEYARVPRRLYRGSVEPTSANVYNRIVAMTPVDEATYANAAFVRSSSSAEPMRFSNPDGALMLYSASEAATVTAMVARVNFDGTVAWSHDMGLDRFSLQQILPGEGSTAFVGTRPPVPNKVSEPLLVIVDHATGAVRTESLWR